MVIGAAHVRMEWTKPLTFALTTLVSLLAIYATIEIGRTTIADSEYAIASAVTLVALVLVVLGTVAVGARNRRWVSNPDSYW